MLHSLFTNRSYGDRRSLRHTMTTHQDYTAQVKGMVHTARAWIKANPERTPKIQFNFPTSVRLIASIEGAIANGLISANADGLDLIKAMGADLPEEKEPTVFMVQAAMDFLEDPRI